MYCRHCGKELSDDAAFCSKCGTKQRIAEPITQQNEWISREQKEAPADKVLPLPPDTTGSAASGKKHNGKRAIYIACGAVAAILLAVIFIITLPRETNSKPSDPHDREADAAAPVVEDIKEINSLSLSEYVSEYNAVLRRSVSTTVNTNVSDADYISCAKTLINKALKNPSTAQYNSSSVYDKDNYGRAVVYLDVSAQNSLGGWVRSEFYVCIQSYKNDGTFTYNSTVPYTDDKKNYDLLLLINDFGKDPADEELEGMILADSDFVMDGSIRISPTQTLDRYQAVMDDGLLFAYADAETKKMVSVRFVPSASGSTTKREKIIAAAAAVLTDSGMATAKSDLANMIVLSSFSPTSTPTYYSDGFVYDCGYGYSDVDVAVTIVNKSSYDSKLYWTPNNEEAYYEALADKYAENKDYDNAIFFYEEVMLIGDKLFAAYYGKAEQSLEAGDLDTAGLYFGYAGSYKDSAVRVLEVFYNAGEQYEKNNDYISAISSYLLADNYSDAKEKYKECNFKQGEKYASNKQYLEAASCYEDAADYSGANERYKETCYLYAEQQLLTGSIDTAFAYFTKAGDYKDAATRMQKYYYEQGNDRLAGKDYQAAIGCFKKIMGYSDAGNKYKEANYLYGEQLLASDNVSGARSYFLEASGYKDADTRISRYYYENGSALFTSKDYLDAAEAFAKALNYSDSSEKEKECYYLYGKKQLELNYISSAVEYLSKCRGYKDTDDVLLGYYYGEASAAVDVLMKAFQVKTFTSYVDNSYKDAKDKLVLCEGYKDSSTLLKVVEKLYYVWTEMQYESKFEASLYDMSASYSGSTISITKSNFISGKSCDLSMTSDLTDQTFTASITDIPLSSARSYDVQKVICAMLVLFTDIKDTTDFNAKCTDRSSWSFSNDRESFSLFYGGYTISIQSEPAASGAYSCTDLRIEAVK